MKKKFAVNVFRIVAQEIEVEAETEEEALEKAQEMVDGGEVDLSTMELGDYGYESIGEVTDED